MNEILEEALTSLRNAELIDKDKKTYTGLMEVKKAEEIIYQMEVRFSEILNRYNIKY
jgi:hypothetical protein